MRVRARTLAHTLKYIENFGTVRIGRRKLAGFIRHGEGNAEKELTEGRTFTLENFFSPGPCERRCQFVQTPRFIFWPSLVSENEWALHLKFCNKLLDQIHRLDRYEPGRTKRCFLSSLSLATGSTFFHYSM